MPLWKSHINDQHAVPADIAPVHITAGEVFE